MKKVISTTVSMMFLVLMISCEGFKANKISELAGLQEAESTLSTEDYKDLDYVEVKIKSKDIFNDDFDSVEIKYLDTTVKKIMGQSEGGSAHGFTDPKAVINPPKKYEIFKLNEIDFSFINQKSAESVKQVSENFAPEFETFTLSSVNITKPKDKLKIVFNVNMAKVGDKYSVKGGMNMINYYQVNCTVEDDGTITLKEG